jgi:hypothetical protein
MRRSGGTAVLDGGPLTTAAWHRIRQWRQEWQALPSQVIPAVIGPGHTVRSGADGLRYLADLAAEAGVAPRPEPGEDLAPVRELAAAQAA